MRVPALAPGSATTDNKRGDKKLVKWIARKSGRLILARPPELGGRIRHSPCIGIRTVAKEQEREPACYDSDEKNGERLAAHSRSASAEFK
jgi:hypothetical protein